MEAKKKRLTTTPGYDGGAFFSRDGKKMVWRANHPAAGAGLDRYTELLGQDLTAPMKMELFVANSDGSDSKQITNFGCASFAPQFTPDGKTNHLRFEQEQMRQPGVRVIPDRHRRQESRTGDVVWRLHLVS